MVSIKKHSGIYILETEQFVNTDIKKAWLFFTNPLNLEKLTPKNMGFKVTSATKHPIYAGQIISYKIGIIPFFKSNWVTEITTIKNEYYFIDEQRIGPYRLWHHEHHFESNNKGVIMKDIVSYKIPLGFIGHLIHALFIKSKLKYIFNYRMKVLPDILKSLN